MTGKARIINEFKKQITIFCDELIEQFPEEGDLVIMRIFLIDQVQIEDILKFFTKKLESLREMITDRNESFFLENDILYQQLDSNKVGYFKKLWPNLDPEDQDIVWKWFDLFVILSDKFKTYL